jgi:phosphate:Na+ symporter
VPATETIGQPSADKASEVVAAKTEIEMLAAAARQSVLDKLRLGGQADVLNFRLATDLIEQFKQVARFSRAIAKAAEDF